MKKYFLRIFNSAVGFIKGMLVTVKYLFTHAITVQYPKQKLTLSPRYRGFLVFDGKKCTSCGLCVKACPVNCITLNFHQDESMKKRVVDSYKIDFGRCNFCGLCEESCPVQGKAIKHSKEYEMVFLSRNEMVREMA